MLAQYSLRAELVGHSKDVRCVLPVDGVAGNKSESVILSGSRDSTAKIWLEDNESRVYALAHSLADHKNFVTALAYMDPNEEHAFGIIFTASRDKSIRAYAAESPPRFLYQLLGHENTISGLAIDMFHGFLVSSSWDNTARIWSGQDCLATLSGHLAAVWAVAVVPPHASQVEETQHYGTSLPRILTASADRTIKLWHGTAEQRTFVGHSDAVRGLAVLSAREFLSCSNDGSVRRWLAESGSCVAVYSGHENYIYGDGVVRIFTLDKELVSGSLALSTYDAEVATFGQAIEASDEIGGIKIADMPGVESLQQPGKRDGATKMVRRGQTVECHQWSDAERKWTKLGDVVSGRALSSGKEMYLGKEYDFVFSIDVEDGKPPIKLPYNCSDDPWQAAQEFIHTNDLPQVYLDQVAQFIIANCPGAGAGSATAPSDPFTGEQRYVPVPSTSSSNAAIVDGDLCDRFTGADRYIPGSGQGGTGAENGLVDGADPLTASGSYVLTGPTPGADPKRPRPELIPLPDYITFTSVVAQKLKEKLRENNEKVPANRKLTDTDLAALESFLEAHKDTVITAEHYGALNRALTWSVEFLVPVLDIFRMALLLPAINEHFFGAAGGAGREALLDMCGLLRTDGGKAPPAPAIVILVCRALANAFAHAAGRQAVLGCVKDLLPFVLASLSTPKPAAQVAAAATLANLALLLHQAPRGEAIESAKQSWLVDVICHLMSSADYCTNIDQDALLKILQAFATLLCDDELFIRIARSLKLDELLVRIKDAVEEEKAKDLARTMERILGALAMSVFDFHNVRWKNGYKILAKLSALRQQGVNRLQVLSDFDSTLTKFGPGNQASYEIAVAAVSAKRPELADELKNLAAHYKPIEFNPALSISQKTADMVAWYTKQNQIIVDARITLQELNALVEDCSIRLRDKCAQFFAALGKSGVPLVIFSAGIGEVIDIFLKLQLGHISQNVHVIANFMDFDDKDTVIGFKSPLIHTFNKSSSVIPEELPTFFEQLHSRPNVLLLGDTIGDSHMDLGLLDEPESSVVLKIGFINKDADNLLQSYLDVFDVVILEDQTFDVILALWEEISSAVPNNAEN